MADDSVVAPPRSPVSRGRSLTYVPVPSRTGQWSFTFAFRLANAVIAWLTAMIISTPIAWARGWTWDSVSLGLLATVATFVTVLGEALRARSWEHFQRGETEKLDRIAAERLLSLTVPPKLSLQIRRRRSRMLRDVLKRVFDVECAALGLLVLAPVFWATAVLVKLDSPGPALFGQLRVGRFGRMIRVYKFRTMFVDAGLQRELVRTALAESGESLGDEFDDPRITRVGRYLRRLSLELPLFISVLLGDLSIVGPRPMTTDDIQRMRESELEELLSVRPGIAPPIKWASTRSAEDRLRSELEYVRTWSLRRDIGVLLDSVACLLRTAA